MEVVGLHSQSKPQGAELLVALYKTTQSFNICISLFHFF